MKGRAIEGLDAARGREGVAVFEAATRNDGDVTRTSGGRVLCVTATGDDVQAAAERAYAAVADIRFEGAQVRADIGWQARGSAARSVSD